MLFGIICGLVCHFLLENIGSEMFLGLMVKCPCGQPDFRWLCIVDNKISKVLFMIFMLNCVYSIIFFIKWIFSQSVILLIS